MGSSKIHHLDTSSRSHDIFQDAVRFCLTSMALHRGIVGDEAQSYCQDLIGLLGCQMGFPKHGGLGVGFLLIDTSRVRKLIPGKRIQNQTWRSWGLFSGKSSDGSLDAEVKNCHSSFVQCFFLVQNYWPHNCTYLYERWQEILPSW